MTFREAGSQIPSGLVALNQMIRRERMHHIFRAPLRHVTIRATRRRRVLSRGNRPRELLSVALPACRVIVPDGLLSSWDIVRIVACGAFQRPFALQEALRFPNAVYGVHQLELVVASAAGRMIEE